MQGHKVDTGELVLGPSHVKGAICERDKDWAPPRAIQRAFAEGTLVQRILSPLSSDCFSTTAKA